MPCCRSRMITGTAEAGRSQPVTAGVIASASEAIHGARKQEWIASSLALLAMTAIPRAAGFPIPPPPLSANNRGTGSPRRRAGIGSRAVSSAHQHGPARLQVNSVPHREQARRREAGISNRFVINRNRIRARVLHVRFMPNGGIFADQYTRRDNPREIRWPAIRKPRLSRSIASGFGARGGASGDLVNAASDPRGFVKAELSRANGVPRRWPRRCSPIRSRHRHDRAACCAIISALPSGCWRKRYFPTARR